MLHFWHADTTLHHDVPPPRARGFTWSKVRACREKRREAYSQAYSETEAETGAGGEL